MKTLHGKSAFTLIEILVVIAIIGILMGLLTMGIGQVRIKVKNMKMAAELKQLELAIQRVRDEMGGGEYPPDGTDPVDLQRWCRRAFPKAQFTTAQTPTYPLVPYPNTTNCSYAPLIQPDTAMVFWLGGIRDPSSGACMGFSSNQADPFDYWAQKNGSPLCPSRVGPFYDFDKSRLVAVNLTLTTSGSVPVIVATSEVAAYSIASPMPPMIYFPQNDKPLPVVAQAGATAPLSYSPMLYFKAVAGKYSTTESAPASPPTNQSEFYHRWVQTASGAAAYITPFKDSKTQVYIGMVVSGGVQTRAWMNPKSCQILCPGVDGMFGVATGGTFLGSTAQGDSVDAAGIYAPIYPDGLNYDSTYKYTNDDNTNFMQGSKLQDDMPQ
jgi:prepilin-type N-terminal cleavage/methylation domain-containing protein